MFDLLCLLVIGAAVGSVVMFGTMPLLLGRGIYKCPRCAYKFKLSEMETPHENRYGSGDGGDGYRHL